MPDIPLESGAVPAPAQEWLRPSACRLDRTRVFHRYSKDAVPAGPDRAILRRFTRLAGASPDVIRKFVERYGALRVTDSGRPHFMKLDATGENERKHWWSEPLQWYGHYAQVLTSAVRLADEENLGRLAEWHHGERVVEHFEQDAARLDRGEHIGLVVQGPGGGAWWDPWRTTERARRGPWSRASQDELVRGLGNWWLTIGNVYPELQRVRRTSVSRARYELGWPGGLWAALGGALVDRLRQAGGSASCANCDRPVTYPSGKAPKYGQLAWCADDPDCQRAKNRHHQASARARARTARS